MHNCKRMISVLLTLVLLFSFTMPASAIEAETVFLNESNASAAPEQFSPNVQTQEDVTVRVREITSLRETNSETYLLSDGSYECVVYAEDKYFINESNALQLIDNTVVSVGSTSALQVANDIDSRYKNTANAFDIYFSSSGVPEISIDYQDSSLAFSPLNATQKTNHMTASTSDIAVGPVNNCIALTQLTATGDNTVTYANAFPNTDLVYVLENNMLKEYIILKNASAPNSFSFLFAVENATFVNDNGKGCFTDAEGNVLFSLASLFAIDSNEKITNAVTYSYEVVPKLGGIVITITLDDEYLFDSIRTFPVVIDPTIMISSVETADTCVCSYYETTNYYTSSYLRTGMDTDFGIRRSYIKFDLNTVPRYADVTSAMLKIEMVSGAVPNVYAYRCIDTWTSNTLTWGSKPGYTTTGASTKALAGNGSWYSLYVTDIVEEWVENLLPNYGFVLKDSVESNTSQWTTFYSSDAVSPHKPELHIYYNTPDYLFTNYYDSTFSGALSWRIPSAVNTVNSSFSQLFSVTFGSHSSATRRYDLSDACSLSVNSRCTSACAIHHKNALYISDQLHAESRASNEIKVYWTDRPRATYCTHYSGSCELFDNGLDDTTIAVVYYNRPIIHIMNLITDDGTYAEFEACMGINLTHETAHTFGLNDRYSIEQHWGDGYQCVMEGYLTNMDRNYAESFYSAISSGTNNAFCTRCAQDLAALLT